MAIPMRKILKSSKFDAVVSFKKPDGSRKSPRGNSHSSPGGPTKKSPTDTRRDKTPKTSATTQGKTQKNKTSSKNDRGSCLTSAKDDGEVTSSVVAVLADKGASSARKNNYHNAILNGATANRADRLQVRLNALESEMSRLKLHEEQLEHRLKTFLRQKTALVNHIDDIHMKLDGLARSHKAVSYNK